MRRLELVCINKTNSHSAFTLIEVMVAVMIISVVVASLLKLFSNNTHMIASLEGRLDAGMYATLFTGEIEGVGDEFGFENDEYYLSDLVRDFDIEDDLRRKLKEKKAKIIYKIEQQIDAAAMQDSLESNQDAQNEANNEDETVDERQGSNMGIIEVGRTIVKLPSNDTSSFLRIRLLSQ